MAARLAAVFSFALMIYANASFSAKAASVAIEGKPWAEWFKSVLQRMEKDAGGELQIQTFLNGKLGGEREIVEEVYRNRVQIFGGSVGAVASSYVPELNALELPFLFESDSEVDFVLEKLRADVTARLAKKGFVLLQWSENGWHGFGSKQRCIQTSKDLVGLRMRSQQSAIHLDTYRALGATPVEMAVPEVLSALQTGVVDGFSNTPLFAMSSGWYRPIKFFSYTRHIYQPAFVVASKTWFDSLSPKLKAVLLARPEEKSGLATLRALVPEKLQEMKKEKLGVCEPQRETQRLMAQQTRGVWTKLENKSKGCSQFLKRIVEAKKAFGERLSGNARNAS